MNDDRYQAVVEFLAIDWLCREVEGWASSNRSPRPIKRKKTNPLKNHEVYYECLPLLREQPIDPMTKKALYKHLAHVCRVHKPDNDYKRLWMVRKIKLLGNNYRLQLIHKAKLRYLHHR